MTAPVVRRLRLPPAPSSPAVARAVVAEALAAGGLGALVDEALLLTTELVTNGVVHAGTELELEISTDPLSVSVLVVDHDRELLTLGARTTARTRRGRGLPAMTTAGGRPEPGQVEALAGALRAPGRADPGPPHGDRADSIHGEALAERGRGLLLVDHLASSWGTLQHGAGKGVWFRLQLPVADPQELRGLALLPAEVRRQPAPPVPDDPAAAPAELPARDATAPGSRYTGLLHRLCTATGATAAAVLVDSADGRGAMTVAAVGQPAGPADELRFPLGLGRPLRGELVVAAPDAGYTAPLAELAAEHVTLLLENDRLRRVDAERRAWLTFLAEASELLAQSLDVELTLALVPRIAVPRLGRWCAVHTTEDGELHLAAVAHADEDQVGDLVDRLTASAEQVAEALRVDGGMPLPAPLDGYAVPLVARGQPLGTLAVGGAAGPGWPGAEEAAVIEDVARRVAVAIDNARIHADRRDVAHQLQRSLLPPVLPRVSGVEFGAEYVPAGAGGDAGGDFYDVMAVSDDSWLIVVGDVSGKGVQAAAVTGLVRDVIRVLVRDGRPLPDVLARLNGTLVERGGGRFCTLALALVTRQAAGQLDVGLFLAGHDQPILVRGDGSADLVGRCGTALGLLEAVTCPRSEIRLGHGEALIFYTDGVTERRRGEDLFGQVRLCHEAALLAGYPAAAVAARLRASALGFSGEAPRDDIAIFVIRNDGGPHPDATPQW